MKFKREAKLLKEAREVLGFTQKDLANKMKWHCQFISNQERGVAGCPPKSIDQICEILKISRERLIKAKIADFKEYLERSK